MKKQNLYPTVITREINEKQNLFTKLIPHLTILSTLVQFRVTAFQKKESLGERARENLIKLSSIYIYGNRLIYQ